jgi:hypothetical protein
MISRLKGSDNLTTNRSLKLSSTVSSIKATLRVLLQIRPKMKTFQAQLTRKKKQEQLRNKKNLSTQRLMKKISSNLTMTKSLKLAKRYLHRLISRIMMRCNSA